jgi:uncharacterized membrane protein
VSCLVLFLVASGLTVTAQDQSQQLQNLPTSFTPANEFYKAKVVEAVVIEQDPNSPIQYAGKNQKLKVELLNGPDKGEVAELTGNLLVRSGDSSLIRVGETVLVLKNSNSVGDPYFLNGRYRLNSIYLWILLFIILVIGFSGLQGVRSILSLILGVVIIIQIIVPNIVSGVDTFTVILGGIILIAVVTLYLAHGINQRTTVALVSTLITLGFSVVCSIIAVKMVGLSGGATEEAFYLQYNKTLENINLQGLFLGGVLIGTLGVLDDITTAQTAVVAELKRANNSLSWKELYIRSLSVGREHIASLVNTLAFAYIGASFPVFLSYIFASNLPWWVLLNSDQIVEEIIQTLVGSSALVVAVPVSSYLAARWFASHPPKNDDIAHLHTHGHIH